MSPNTREYVIKMQSDIEAKEAKETARAEAEAKAALSAWVQAPEAPKDWPIGTRRLRDLPRHVSRPLECQQYSMKLKGNVSRAEMSSRLDLHPDDLEALAATAGQI